MQENDFPKCQSRVEDKVLIAMKVTGSFLNFVKFLSSFIDLT